MGVDINKAAGTIKFPLNQVECVLRVTWEAVASIENDLGYGMVPLARKVALSSFGLKDMATVVLHGLKASGTEGNPDFAKVATQIMKAGLLNPDLIMAVSEFCDLALSGGEEPKKD